MKRASGLLALLFLVSTAPVLAGVSVDQSEVLDRWTIRVGGYSAGLDTTIRLDAGVADLGTEVSLEDDLGFSSSETLPSFKILYIIGKRHQLGVGYFKTDRDSSTTIRSEIEWGDEVFPIDTNIKGFYNTEFTNLTYTYWFYSSQKTALGVTGGLALASVTAGVAVDVLTLDVVVEDDLSTGAPVPQLGFSANHMLGKRFVLWGNVGYITFSNLGDFSGDVSSALVGVEHRTWKNLGFGLNYNFQDFNIDADDAPDFLGKFTYRISGFELYLRAAF